MDQLKVKSLTGVFNQKPEVLINKVDCQFDYSGPEPWTWYFWNISVYTLARHVYHLSQVIDTT